MNKCFFIGRAVKDPEVRTGDMTVARFTLAVDRRVKKDKEQSADFIPCVAFGKTGDFIEKYIKKGTKIVVEGRWQTGSYTNKEGTKIYTNDCVVEAVEFAESKKADDAPAAKDDTSSFMNIPDDDEIPFQSELPL